MITKWSVSQINTAFREKKLIDYLDLYGQVVLLVTGVLEIIRSIGDGIHLTICKFCHCLYLS